MPGVSRSDCGSTGPSRTDGSAVISRWVMENSRVEREYLDEELRRLATSPGSGRRVERTGGLGAFTVLFSAHVPLHIEADLRNMRDAADRA